MFLVKHIKEFLIVNGLNGILLSKEWRLKVGHNALAVLCQ